MNTFDIIDQFFRKLGIQIDSLHIEEREEEIQIDIQTPDSALLIGMHGKNIAPIRHLLTRILEKQTNKFLHIHLEINDYIKSQDTKLYRMLDEKITLLQAGGEVTVPNLTPFERKKAHDYIAHLNITGISSQSEGTAGSRTLHIRSTGPGTTKKSPVSEKSELTLPEDGVGI